MKAPIKQRTLTPPTPVFPQTPHLLRPDGAAAGATPKTPKRENTFSKSRDTREDRGTREMKTTHNAQTISHGR